MKHVIDPQYLAKLKKSGYSDQLIASRFGVTLGDIQEAWAEIQAIADILSGSGYDTLKRVHETACLQFQELGKTLGVVGFALANHMPLPELKALYDESLKQADPIAYLSGRMIILRPYVQTETEREMEAYVAEYHNKEALATGEFAAKN